MSDETRLKLLAHLSREREVSISRLAEGHSVTRQAITKHLRVLHRAGLVRNIRHGRETRFSLVPSTLDEARQTLDGISKQWDTALARLKATLEAE